MMGSPCEKMKEMLQKLNPGRFVFDFAVALYFFTTEPGLLASIY